MACKSVLVNYFSYPAGGLSLILLTLIFAINVSDNFFYSALACWPANALGKKFTVLFENRLPKQNMTSFSFLRCLSLDTKQIRVCVRHQSEALRRQLNIFLNISQPFSLNTRGGK